MELKRGPLSFIQLLTGALKTANQVFGAALGLFFLMLGIMFVIGVVTALVVRFVNPFALMMLQIPLGILNSFVGLIVSIALIQLIASKIEGTGLGVMESIKTSFLPSIYFFISSAMLAVVGIAVLFAAALSHLIWVVFATYLILGFAFLPFIFTPQVAALRGEGPVNALRYSWQLGTAHYCHILLMLLMLCGTFIVLALACVCACKAFLPALFENPLAIQFQVMMWMSQIPKLYLAFGLLTFLLLYGYVILTMQSFFTGLFLNLDYCHRSINNRDADMPLIETVEEDAAPLVDISSPDIEIKQASVYTHTDEIDQTNLQQVYSANEHISFSSVQEEDRMPTILFDDDMARQLQENERKMQERQATAGISQEDDGQQSIKISDKEL